MNNIPTLNEKLEQIGYNKAVQALQDIANQLDQQYTAAQNNLNAVLKKHGIAAEDFYINPSESYIRLSDHKKRRLHNNTWLCIDLVRNEAGMATQLLGIRFESKQYIQDVKPKQQNLIICAETLEYFAELLRAFKDQELVQDYIHCINQYADAITETRIKRQPHDAIVKQGNELINFSKNMLPIIDSEFNNMEELMEYFNSCDANTLKNIMQLNGLITERITKKELLNKIENSISIYTKPQ